MIPVVVSLGVGEDTEFIERGRNVGKKTSR